MTQPVELRASDGARLGATLFRPAAGNGRAVTIQPATGVKQEYYARFAAYLAERGFTVLSFDYRGVGRSLPAGRTALRGFDARMRDWGLQDAPAALDFLERAAPGARLMAIGHSFGGQALGLMPRAERLAAALFVGAQSGYWRNWPLRRRGWMWLAAHFAFPVLPRLLGYFPSTRLGLGEDLPAGVARDWGLFCRHPHYLIGALDAYQAYARFNAPIRVYAPTDDSFAPRRAVEALLALYPSAKSELLPVAPRDVGAEAIGHFGFFRERFRDTLWREAADWLARH